MTERLFSPKAQDNLRVPLISEPSVGVTTLSLPHPVVFTPIFIPGEGRWKLVSLGCPRALLDPFPSFELLDNFGPKLARLLLDQPAFTSLVLKFTGILVFLQFFLGNFFFCM
jgi:hypothetical protein